MDGLLDVVVNNDVVRGMDEALIDDITDDEGEMPDGIYSGEGDGVKLPDDIIDDVEAASEAAKCDDDDNGGLDDDSGINGAEEDDGDMRLLLLGCEIDVNADD